MDAPCLCDWTPNNNPGHQISGELPRLTNTLHVLSNVIAKKIKQIPVTPLKDHIRKLSSGLLAFAPMYHLMVFNLYPLAVSITAVLIPLSLSSQSQTLRMVLETPNMAPLYIIKLDVFLSGIKSHKKKKAQKRKYLGECPSLNSSIAIDNYSCHISLAVAIGRA